MSTGDSRPDGTARRQRRRQRNRAALREAARACFQHDGFLATKISDITQAADVSHGTFYSYFTSKDEAFTEIVDEVLDELFTVVRDPGPVPSLRQRLRLALTAFLRQCGQQRRILRALQQASHLRPEYAVKWDGFRQRLQQQVEHDLGGLQRMRHIRGDVDIALVSIVVTRMVEGVATHVIHREDADVDALAATAATLYFDAVFRTSPPADVTLG